jgi:transcriptional regulator
MPNIRSSDRRFYIGPKDRDRIIVLRAQGVTFADIGRRLGFTASAVGFVYRQEMARRRQSGGGA